MQKKEQTLYWNRVASSKDFTTQFYFDKFSNYVKKNMRILDFGSGYGRTLYQLYNKGYKNIIGLDISKNMIQRGKSLHPYINQQHAKDSHIHYEGCSFDAVILLSVLTCITKDEKQINLLKEIWRVLKPGGIFYVNDFLLNFDVRNIKRYADYNKNVKNSGRYGIFQYKKNVFFRHHNENWIHLLLENFHKIEFEKVIFETMNGNLSNGFYYIGKKNGRASNG